MSLSTEQVLWTAKTLVKQGQPGQAMDALAEALTRFPANARLRSLLAEILSSSLRLPARPFTEAHLARLMQIKTAEGAGAALSLARVLVLLDPASPFAQGTAGALAVEAGLPDIARPYLQTALRLDPAHVGAALNLVRAEEASGDPERALDLLKALHRQPPGALKPLVALGHALMRARLFVEAQDIWLAAQAKAPDDRAIATALSAAAAQTGHMDLALQTLQDHLSRSGPDYPALVNLGNLLLSENRLPEAAAAFEAAIALDPRKGGAHYNLSRAVRFGPDDPRIARMQDLLSQTDLPAEDAMQIEFALAKALDDLRQPEAAFPHFARANALRRHAIAYSLPAEAAEMQRIRDAFPAPLAPLPPLAKPPARQPIFVLGMMRSGTTLMEQILTSHPMVDGAGELDDLGDLLTPLVAAGTPPTAAQLEKVRAAYLARLDAVPGAAPFVVDKMPFNFRWIGAIARLFPQAPILHMKRDPMAVCWSIWRTYFTSPRIGFAYQMDEVAGYHHLYRAMMDHWQRLGPAGLTDVSYEALTSDPEATIRHVLDRSGLPWDAACLSPEQNRRAIRTASLTQARRSITAGGNDQWRSYQGHLGPLLQALQDPAKGPD